MWLDSCYTVTIDENPSKKAGHFPNDVIKIKPHDHVIAHSYHFLDGTLSFYVKKHNSMNKKMYITN